MNWSLYCGPTKRSQDQSHYGNYKTGSIIKENMKYINGLRHMDAITHMFDMFEASEKHYASAIMLAENPHFLEGVFCDIRWFVKAQQYLFESLWKAIPAKQRFKEIEEGSKREFAETIRDPLEISSPLISIRRVIIIINYCQYFQQI